MIVKGVSGKSGFFAIELPIELPIKLPIGLPIQPPAVTGLETYPLQAFER